MTITITHRQRVRLATWFDNITAEVFTISGYAVERGDDPAAKIKRAVEFGHDMACTIYTGATLLGDRAEATRRLDAERAAAAAAVILTNGQTVEIDGTLYTVRVMPGNAGKSPTNSDPIHFIPVQ